MRIIRFSNDSKSQIPVDRLARGVQKRWPNCYSIEQLEQLVKQPERIPERFQNKSLFSINCYLSEDHQGNYYHKVLNYKNGLWVITPYNEDCAFAPNKVYFIVGK